MANEKVNTVRRMDMNMSGSVIVSWDFSHGEDIGVLIVGEQKNGKINVINAYQGKEALELYKKLHKTRFA